MSALLCFLLALPLAVQTGSALLCLLDQPDRSRGLLRLSECLAVLAALMLLGGPDGRAWIGWAYACVAGLHIAAQVLMRLGVRRQWWVSERIE